VVPLAAWSAEVGPVVGATEVVPVVLSVLLVAVVVAVLGADDAVLLTVDVVVLVTGAELLAPVPVGGSRSGPSVATIGRARRPLEPDPACR
jgi:hypothetical protein